MYEVCVRYRLYGDASFKEHQAFTSSCCVMSAQFPLHSYWFLCIVFSSFLSSLALLSMFSTFICIADIVFKGELMPPKISVEVGQI